MDMRILIKMVDSRGIERTGSANYPVNFIVFFQQEIRQVRSVLACNTCDQRSFHLHLPPVSAQRHRNHGLGNRFVNLFCVRRSPFTVRGSEFGVRGSEFDRGTFSKDTVLAAQLRKTMLSIYSNFGEGFERDGNREFVQFVSVSKGSVGELRAQLLYALDLGYFGWPIGHHL